MYAYHLQIVQMNYADSSTYFNRFSYLYFYPKMPHSSDSKFIPALKFRWLTPYYDAVVEASASVRIFKRALIHQTQIKPGQQVLDLACGTGTLTIWLKQYEPNAVIIGVDGDPAILNIARRKAKRAHVAVQFDKALSYALPYPDASFDCIVSSLFFHHLIRKDKQRTAQELLRVLKPGGELHVADWGYPTNILMRGLFLAVQLFDGFENTRDNVAGRLPEIFAEAGFIDVVQRQTFNTIAGTMTLYSARKAA